MIVYYEILDSGLGVRIYKPFFESSTVTEKKFIKKSELLTCDKIREKIPEPHSSNIIVCMRRVKEINDMKLSAFGTIYDEKSKKIKYIVGNCEFDNKENAIIHGEDIYSAGFIKDNERKFNSGRLYYFKNIDEISEREYKEIKKEYKELLQIKKIKLVKENKPNLPKR